MAVTKTAIGMAETKPVEAERRADPPAYLADLQWVRSYINSMNIIFKDMGQKDLISEKKALKEIMSSQAKELVSIASRVTLRIACHDPAWC